MSMSELSLRHSSIKIRAHFNDIGERFFLKLNTIIVNLHSRFHMRFFISFDFFSFINGFCKFSPQ